jgi:hypothetical protein
MGEEEATANRLCAASVGMSDHGGMIGEINHWCVREIRKRVCVRERERERFVRE